MYRMTKKFNGQFVEKKIRQQHEDTQRCPEKKDVFEGLLDKED